MITVFILSSEQVGSDHKKTLESFGNIVFASHRVVNNSEINGFIDRNEVFTEWYCVLNDCEYVDERLSAALPVFIEQCGCKRTLSFYKKEGAKVEICPRVFKAYVRLPEAGLLPACFDKASNETCLNGWVRRL